MIFKDVALFIADGDQNCTMDVKVGWNDVVTVHIDGPCSGSAEGVVNNIKMIDNTLIGDVNIIGPVIENQVFRKLKPCFCGIQKRNDGGKIEMVKLAYVHLSLHNRDKRIKSLGEYGEK